MHPRLWVSNLKQSCITMPINGSQMSGNMRKDDQARNQNKMNPEKLRLQAL